jgi:hypothetical protein
VRNASWIPAALLVLLAPQAARADRLEWMPGNGREIPRSASASRDAPTAGLVFGPRVAGKAAVDFAFARLVLGGVALRPGFDAFFELEHSGVGVRGALPLPGRGRGDMLWRGMYRGSLALSAERLARQWFGTRGAIEITLTLGHESDHVTGGSFDDAPRHGDILYGGGGDFAIYEAALRAPVSSRIDVWSRAEDRAYLRGAIRHAPGLDAGLRWHAWPHLEPVVSVFGEALLVDHNVNRGRHGYFVSLLAGAALPGRRGELLPYSAVEVGNGKGLLINHRELRWTIGVRYAPF